MEAHYNRIADRYDYLFGYEDSYAEEQTGDIIKWLALEQSDILADIGGGTGKWSHSILRQLKLDNDVILVDQNEVMVNTGGQVTGISAVSEDIMEFVKQEGLRFNKCLIRSCIHHLTDAETFLARLYAVPSLQRVLVLMREGALDTIPMFKRAHQATGKQNTDCSDVVRLAKKAGFEVCHTSKTYQVSIEKDYWLSCIENRVFSSLDHFSDEELKEGQREICEQYPGDPLLFPDIWDVIVLSRKI